MKDLEKQLEFKTEVIKEMCNWIKGKHYAFWYTSDDNERIFCDTPEKIQEFFEVVVNDKLLDNK